MATIYDVAKLAGVSPKTVSRFLNGDAPVSEKTKERVKAAVDELQYAPSLAARSMRSSRSGLIGLITGAISSAKEHETHSGLPDIQIVQGIQTVIQNAGMTLMIADTGGAQERVPELVRTFRQHRVEGLLFVSDAHKTVDFEIPSNQISTVLVNCFDDFGTPAVLPDDENGQFRLVEKVIAQGHKRIAYLTLSPAQIATKLRLVGYKTALAQAGIAFDPEIVAPADLYGKNGEHQLIWDALEKFLSLAEPPSVICCGNDRLAMAVYGILRDRGIEVPEQISVVGYDDHKLVSEALYPSLTTAELPYFAMGARAAHLMLDMIENPGSAGQANPILVGGKVVERQSLRTFNAEANIFHINRRKNI